MLIVVLRGRWITLAVTLILFAIAVVGLRLVPQQFFPSSDRVELLVDLKLPQNASIYATDMIATQLDEMLRDDKDIEHWTTYVGRGAPRFYLPLVVQLPNDFVAQAVLVKRAWRRASGFARNLRRRSPRSFPQWSAASTRSNWVRRSAGPCSTA